MLFSSSSCLLFHAVLGGKEQKLLFFMKCSPQIALYVSSCFMQSLCACSRVESLAHGQASGKNQRNTKTIFIQHFLNVLIPWSPWIFFLLLLFRFFVSFSFTSSFVEFLHIIRREKASQKAHSHHQDKHYRTGSLSQGKGREGSGGGALQWRGSEEGGAGDEEGVFKSINKLKRKESKSEESSSQFVAG